MVDAARRVAGLVVGIDEYGALSPVSKLDHLKYCQRDAEAVLHYLESVWPRQSEPGFAKLTGSGATRAAFQTELMRISTSGPLELFVLYLSGHGWLDAEGRGAFALIPTEGDPVGLLGPEELDAILHRVPAEQVLLFVDCCHAETLLRGVTFFTQIGAAKARLFICSSRQNQMTWEEDSVRHGVFTAFLLDALNAKASHRGPPSQGAVDVESELFPYLCEQVPLYVYSHKGGAHQEPVGGGIGRTPVRLPGGAAARRARDSTLLQTVVRRVRQVGQVTAIAVICVLLLTYVFGYYVDSDSSGRLIIKHGMRELEPLLRWLPLERVETPFTTQQLSRLSPGSELQRGGVVGIWTQLSRTGYRLWFDRIVPHLELVARERALLDVTGHLSEVMLASDPHESQAWRTLLFAEAMSIRPQDQDRYATWLKESLPGGDTKGANVDPFNPNRFDFEILDIPKDSFRDYLQAVRVYAALAPDEAFEPFLQMLRLVKQRVHKGVGDADEEKALAAVLRTLVWARTSAGRAAITPAEQAELQALARGGYAPCVSISLAYLGSRVDQTTVHSELLQILYSYYRPVQDGLPTPDQEVVLDALAASLPGSPGDGEVVDDVVSSFVLVSARADPVPVQTFLTDVAQRLPLSPTVKTFLFNRAAEAMAREHDPFYVATARILAANARFLTTDELSRLASIIDAVQAQLPPDSEELAEIYGYLTRQGREWNGMVTSIERYVPTRAEPTQDPHEGAEPVGLRVELTRQSWGAALGRMAQGRVLTVQQEAKLRAFAMNTSNQVGRQAAIRGLVHQMQLTSAREPSALTIRGRLAGFRRDARARELEADLLAAWLATRDRATRDMYVEQLRTMRSEETEVELRQALACVIQGALAPAAVSLPSS